MRICILFAGMTISRSRTEHPVTPAETDGPLQLDEGSLRALGEFFNNHHDKLLCTADRRGEPNVALMGTPRLLPDGTIDFEISDLVSVTLDNIRENKAVMFLAYRPGQRARDYWGARISARVNDIQVAGEKLDGIRQAILDKHGAEKASELQATVNCTITNVRPIVDRAQRWNEPPFES
jgi:hypothetical protein